MTLVLLLASVANALLTEFSAMHWDGQESFQILGALWTAAITIGATFLGAYIFQWLLRRNYEVLTTYTDNLMIAVWSHVPSLIVGAIVLNLLYVATSLTQLKSASPYVFIVSLILGVGYELWLMSQAYQALPGVSLRSIVVVYFLNIVIFLVLLAGIGIVGAILLASFPQIMHIL